MNNFSDTDKGWNKFMAHMKLNAGETAGLVGYLRSSGNYQNKQMRRAEAKRTHSNVKPPEPISLAQLASVHEFGSKDGRIPERSFIRTAVDENSKELKRMVAKAVVKVIEGNKSKAQAVGEICQRVADWIVAKIDSNVPPPNDPSTVKRKHSSHTLIDTGQLKGAVDWEIMKQE